MSKHQRALAILQRTDDCLAQNGRPRHTMSPRQSRPRTLQELGSELLCEALDGEVAASWAEAISAIARAQDENFPENLFWDLDFLARDLLRYAADQDTTELEFLAGEIVELNASYGRFSPIRFRYGHDFVYGFDWAKWVARAPDLRAGHGPFCREFLRHLRTRSGEILARIEADDAGFPKLAIEQRRNPFRFRRDPAAELQLHQHLSSAGLIPVQSWRADAHPRWELPFASLRERAAEELGLLLSVSR